MQSEITPSVKDLGKGLIKTIKSPKGRVLMGGMVGCGVAIGTGGVSFLTVLASGVLTGQSVNFLNNSFKK